MKRAITLQSQIRWTRKQKRGLLNFHTHPTYQILKIVSLTVLDPVQVYRQTDRGTDRRTGPTQYASSTSSKLGA